MTYIDINGHPTWISVGEHSDRTVLLMHGGLSNSDALLDSIGIPLSQTLRVAAFDRRGHGRTADTPEPFHYDSMVDETIAVLEHLGGRSHIVGWSDGGIIGLLVALRRPDLIDRLVTIGANYHFSGVRPMGGDDPDDPFFTMIAASYAERSPDGPEHFMDVAAKTFHMFATEPTMTLADLADIQAPVLVMVGDDDVIELSHTCDLYEAIPGAQLAIVPAASHALPIEHPDTTARLILDFFDSSLPPVTLMPSRRR